MNLVLKAGFLSAAGVGFGGIGGLAFLLASTLKIPMS